MKSMSWTKISIWVLFIVVVSLFLVPRYALKKGFEAGPLSWMKKKTQSLKIDPQDSSALALLEYEQKENLLIEQIALLTSCFDDSQKKSLMKLTGHCQLKIAQVTFHERGFGHAIWINLGKDDIAVKSPVVVGDRLVGIVDYVGSGQSRVKLITHQDCILSARVWSGCDEYIQRQIQSLEIYLKLKNEESSLKTLEAFKQSIQKNSSFVCEAKGELRGNSKFSYSISNRLQGEGFNYDFEDAYEKAHMPNIQIGDLLVTSGLDGNFPEGLCIATVSEVQPDPLDHTYCVEAVTSVDLNQLMNVWVLPPVPFVADQKPLPYWKQVLEDESNFQENK